MTRPRVSPDKRQRTAQACDSCKRRKQKCNGLQPCNTCSKRSLICSFGVTTSEHGSDEQSPPVKRQMVDHTNSPHDLQSPSTSALQQFPPMKTGPGPGPANLLNVNAIPTLQVSQPLIKASPSSHSIQPVGRFPPSPSRPNVFQPTGQTLGVPEKTADAVTGESDSTKDGSGQDEEAREYHSFRMLQDPTGRLLYIGDSASLSYLQLIRMYVESISGPSPFTLDPRRHRIVENAFTLPANIRNTHLLPDKATAHVLIDSFFTNTSGFIQVVNRRAFMATLENCYSDPLHVNPSWLCLLNLVFAIGLVLASPIPGSPEDQIIQKLRADEIDRAEVFYSSAKGLCDPISGFEDADFWSVQALLLMTLYMLAVSKRNAAYAYCGMAIRSGFALGLHRNDTLVVFDAEQQSVRRNIWRSLFVVDAFVAASLGRPTSISNEDCSTADMKSEGPIPPYRNPQVPPYGAAADTSHTSSLGVEASVRSCQVVGTILKTIYSKRKCDAKIAHEIVEQCRPWPKTLDSSLHWRQMSQLNNLNPSHGIAILHVNLLYCHTVILLTRPFFIDLMAKVARERSSHSASQRPQRFGMRMERFSDACVAAAVQSIVLVQSAKDGGYLSRRNPFVLYFLFAAALVVLSNEFFTLHDTASRAETAINNAIGLMTYCAETDPLADRLVFILASFNDVVTRQASKEQRKGSFRFMAREMEDPIRSFFSAHSSSDGASSGSNMRPTPSVAAGLNFGNPNGINSSGMGSMSIASLIQPSMIQQQQANSNMSNSSISNPSPPYSTTRHGSMDGGDSLEGEIDFESLWDLQGISNPVGETGLGLRGVGVGGTTVGATLPFSNNGGGSSGVQGISDSPVPLFGTSGFRAGNS